MNKLTPAAFTLSLLSWLSCNISDEETSNFNYGNDSLAVATTSNTYRQPAHWPAHFGIGRKATRADIAAWDIDISPGGAGLPAGSGNVNTGRAIYEVKCMACHGKDGTGPQNRLMGVMGDTTKAKTIGNYWPYASTLFDYVRRAMPYNAPGSLQNDEVYSLTAYLLYINKVIDSGTVINKRSLPKVTMPAQHLFVNDDRRGGPEVR